MLLGDGVYLGGMVIEHQFADEDLDSEWFNVSVVSNVIDEDGEVVGSSKSHRTLEELEELSEKDLIIY